MIDIFYKKNSLDFGTEIKLNKFISQLLSDSKVDKDYLLSLGMKEYPAKRYHQLEVLGKGSFGTVSRFKDIHEGKFVAIKELKIKELDSSRSHDCFENNYNVNQSLKASTLESFINESKLMMKIMELKNENIIKYEKSYYSVREDRNILIFLIVMDVGDCSLKELIEKRHAEHEQNIYTEAEIYVILRDVANALRALEGMGVYHSDIKPGNIIFSSKEKKYYLADFGVSTLIPPQKRDSDKLEYAWSGTKRYMSPELKRLMGIESDYPLKAFNRKVTSFDPFRSDVYSLGVTCEELMSSVKIEQDKIIEHSENLKKLIANMKSAFSEDRPSFETIFQLAEAYLSTLDRDKILELEVSLARKIDEKRKESLSVRKRLKAYKSAKMRQEYITLLENHFESTKFSNHSFRIRNFDCSNYGKKINNNI